MPAKHIALVVAVALLGACANVKRCSYEGFGRDDWQQPERVVESLALAPGERVADLGAGGGYFTFRLADAVGEGGRVFAVDVDPDMTAYLEKRVARDGHGNVEVIRATPADSGLDDASVDLLFTVNTYHHLDERSAYFRALAPKLAPDGRVAIIDLHPDQGFFFRLFVGGHATEPAQIERELDAAGYRLLETHAFLARQSFQVFALAEDERAAATAPEASVRPGINKPFLSADLDVDQWAERFEGESREIYVERQGIADTLGIEPGMAVADIGAGTGLFLSLLDERVGPEGAVYAVEIAPNFVTHLRERAEREGLAQVEVVVGSERSVELAKASVDLAFVCDVYHHFEYPQASLASLREAIRPGGQLVVIDFERIPGTSPQWLLEHVRAGKQVFRSEVEAAGFELIEEVAVPGLKENYFLRFRRP